MKKSIKLTLGLLGISAISAITVGSVISCSNNNSNLASNNNQDNKNSNNKSSSTNQNSPNDTSFIPYSDLTKSVTKEPSFNAALTAWTNDWSKLTTNPETYLNLITNDFNACLSYSTNLMENNPNFFVHNEQLNKSTFSCPQISLNKNNTFNITYNLVNNYGYLENNKSYANVFTIKYIIKLSNISFRPCLSPNKTYWSTSPSQSTIKEATLFAGEYAFSGSISICINQFIINQKNEFNNAPKWIINEYDNIKTPYSYTHDINSNSENLNLEGPIITIPINADIYLINSYQNGINYGELSFSNNN